MAIYSSIGANPASRSRLARAEQAGRIRRIRAGVYTDDLGTPLEDLVRREILSLVAVLAPGSIVSHRSALEPGLAPASVLFLTGPYRRSLELPGATLRMDRGAGPLPDDIRLDTSLGPTWRASEPRALLENLSTSRGAPAARRTLGQGAVEARLERILARDGSAALNVVRDRARRIAPELALQREFARLDEIVGTLLGTRQGALHHPTSIARARARGMPYDPVRIDLFQALASRLESMPPVIPAARSGDDPRIAAFAESYFSNYIEGTEFELDEARAVVLENRTIEYRDDDTHDIRGTFEAILACRTTVFPTTAQAFREQLRTWNRGVIHSRAAQRPGEWKDVVNRFGDTIFVAPDLVPGTLDKGFELIRASVDPTVRAALAMFIVADVHPFRDGNGRTARLAMNLALSAAGLCRIIIPTVYRDDYFSALHALSHSVMTEPPFPRIEPFLAMLNRAAAFSRWLDSSTLPALLGAIERSNAAKHPTQGRLVFPPS